jgi:Ca-activated chloride channel family protein
VVRQNLRIYTIGIGSEAGGFIPVEQQDGGVEYLKDLHGVRIVSRLNEGTLRRIAQTTGGRFYRAYEGSEIGRALREIVSLERELIGYRKQREWFDLYFPLLVGTAVLFLGAWGMERD